MENIAFVDHGQLDGGWDGYSAMILHLRASHYGETTGSCHPNQEMQRQPIDFWGTPSIQVALFCWSCSMLDDAVGHSETLHTFLVAGRKPSHKRLVSQPTIQNIGEHANFLNPPANFMVSRLLIKPPWVQSQKLPAVGISLPPVNWNRRKIIWSNISKGRAPYLGKLFYN